MPKSIAVVCLLLLAVLWAPDSRADEKPNGELPARVATHHTMGLDEHRLDYEAIAETLPVTDAKGNTTASIFTVSYLADGENGSVSARSASSSMAVPVRLRSFCISARSARRSWRRPESGAVPTPPVRLIDNPATWLGFTDLVFVDPVGTGFSRGKGKEENPDKPFWDVRADIASLGSVIRLWLTRHQRWTSPIYLVGESYGGFRAAAMAQTLPHDVDVIVKGLVLVSPALDLSALHQTERDLLAAAFVLPSYAATAAAYDAASAGGSVAEAERFALSDYLVGLAGLNGTAGRRRPLHCQGGRNRRGSGGYRAPLPRPHPAPHLRPRDPAEPGRGSQPLRQHDRGAGRSRRR